MRLLTGIWLALFIGLGLPRQVAAASPGDPDWVTPFSAAERGSTDRIVDGSVAPAGSFPMAMKLVTPAASQGGRAEPGRAGSVLCGGTLIAPTWILTAGHCVEGFESGPIRIGSPAPSRGDVPVNVVSVLRHPRFGYARGQPVNDIALLRLAEPVAQPVALLVSLRLQADALAPHRHTATVVGWGTTRSGREGEAQPPVSDILLQVDLDVQDPALCAVVYPDMPRDDSEFCAGPRTQCTVDGHCPDSCKGDSGGPLFISLDQSQLIQAGIVSFGDHCGLIGRPGMYTAVGHYEDWIRERVPEAHFVDPPPGAFATGTALLDGVVGPGAGDSPSLRPRVSVSMVDGPRIKLGQPLALRIVSNVPGQLLVFNQNETGSGYLIVPNAINRSLGLISPGRPLLVPDPDRDGYELAATPPTGQNRLVVLVVPQGTALEEVTNPHLTQSEIPNLDGWLQDLLSHLVPGRIATGELHYTIEP